MAGYDWVSCYNFNMPANAVRSGTDLDGSDIYVGQANHERDLLPTKIVPRRREAYVSYNGKEVKVNNFKVLVEKKLCWVHSSNGQVPHGAVPAGRTSSGETLYVGRTKINNATVVGKVHPSHHVLYVPFAGREDGHRTYETLTFK